MGEIVAKVLQNIYYAMFAVLITCILFMGYQYLQIMYSRSKTIEAWLSAAEVGDVKAQLNLADHHSYRRDPAQTRYNKMAAENGCERAQIRMAYQSQDPSEVYHWVKMAADQNSPQGFALLGNCYAKGIGVEKNAIEARRLLSQAYKGVTFKQKRMIRKLMKEIE